MHDVNGIYQGLYNSDAWVGEVADVLRKLHN